jgi:hypothetical protein
MNTRERWSKVIANMVAAIALVQVPIAALGAPSLRFEPAGTNEFVFNTGILKGKLHAEGKSRGLSSVVHIPSGLRLDASMGLVSHYRVFTSNRRYGTAAWDWPSEGRLLADGGVEITWVSTPDRPFGLRAVYRWTSPAVLDLETSVLAKTNLARFESFLASYFSATFTNSRVYVMGVPGRSGTERFLGAEPEAGVWQAFPRDEEALKLIQDGRWRFEPNPVDWAIMPRLACPLGFRRAPASGLTAVLMAPREDCFALLTPHQAEPHYSLYLSLFGGDVRSGETARAHTRLVIVANPSEAEVRTLYQTYTDH